MTISLVDAEFLDAHTAWLSARAAFEASETMVDKERQSLREGLLARVEAAAMAQARNEAQIRMKFEIQRWLCEFVEFDTKSLMHLQILILSRLRSDAASLTLQRKMT